MTQQSPRERITPPPTEPIPARFDDIVSDDNRDEILRNGPVQYITEDPKPRRFAWRLLDIGIGVVVAAAVVVGVVFFVRSSSKPEVKTPPPPATFTLNGAITVNADAVSSDQVVGGSCASATGYDDVQSGAQVTVTDAAGKVVAVGALQAGLVSELFDKEPLRGFASRCSFGFKVLGVAGGQDIYSVEVSHRGEVRFSRAQLDKPISLTLG